jgi:uncharacterized protein (TIGR03435 family)
MEGGDTPLGSLRKVMRTLPILFAVAGVAFAQIADVRASAPSRTPGMRTAMHPGRFEIRSATMSNLIAAAFGVEPDKVVGGPSWLDMDRFDIDATVPANASPQTVRPLLQSLLADRFGLAVHPDQRPSPAFVLSAGSGKPKLKETEGSANPGCDRGQQEAESRAIPAVCQGITMQVLAQQLRAAAGDYITSAVVDQTGLTGAWDFTIRWTPRGSLAAAGSQGITIFDALDKQLGLKLEMKQVPAPVIVVDRVNETPTSNAPEVNASLPPLPPTRFDVATIKPTPPEFHDVRIQTPPNGVINIQGLTLGYLIQTIWFVTPDMMVGAPKSLDTERWDISGKLAASPGSTAPTDMDSMIAAVRTLLEDRFQLKTHTEQRVAPVLTLSAAKPKLQKADPSVRSGCKDGPGPDGKDPRLTNPANSRLVSCRNITMAQFAKLLPTIANALNPLNGIVRSPVIDATGIDGAWDFTLNFAPALAITNDAPESVPSDPNGKLSLAEAIAGQMGLKLSVEKRETTVLVIDHVEPRPTDN